MVRAVEMSAERDPRTHQDRDVLDVLLRREHVVEPTLGEQSDLPQV